MLKPRQEGTKTVRYKRRGLCNLMGEIDFSLHPFAFSLQFEWGTVQANLDVCKHCGVILKPLNELGLNSIGSPSLDKGTLTQGSYLSLIHISEPTRPY